MEKTKTHKEKLNQSKQLPNKQTTVLSRKRPKVPGETDDELAKNVQKS